MKPQVTHIQLASPSLLPPSLSPQPSFFPPPLKDEPPKKEVLHPRPIRTYYYASAQDSVDSWSRRSRAGSINGAVRAAILSVIRRESAHVEFYNEDGVRIGWIHREPRSKKITVMVV